MKRHLLSALAILILQACSTPSAPLRLTPTMADTFSAPATPTQVPKGKTIIVTSAEDSGPGTLRQALREVMPGDIILFDTGVFPPDNPTTIFLSAEDEDSSLPVIEGGITIDASNAGVILDGSNIPGDWANGLEIYSSGNTIQGLQIINFSGIGLIICGGSYNLIGGDRRLGAGPTGQGNLFSKNLMGMDLCEDNTSFNTITGNLVGTNPAGTYRLESKEFLIENEWGNSDGGFWIQPGPSQNIIGPDNIFAFNSFFAIKITGEKTTGNTITQNSIHDNGGPGISLEAEGNHELAPPTIRDYNLEAGSVTGTACGDCTIEIFSSNDSEGEIFEGRVPADGTGRFAFNKGAPFTNPRLTATATDTDGNTSQFARSVGAVTLIQEGNNSPKIEIKPRSSGELADNRIGSHWATLRQVPYPGEMLDDNIAMGVKRFRLSVNDMEIETLDFYWNNSEFFIEPEYENLITKLAENGVRVTYVLTFWDKAYQDAGGKLSTPRFQTEDQIQRYLDYVRFILQHFKGRVQYFELWNEPLRPCTIQDIKVEDYINLVKRTTSVIRQENPEAKIVVGSTQSLKDWDAKDYLFQVIKSEIMPMVDVIAWHPLYGTSPEYDSETRQYYYQYPSLVQEIKDVAASHGFRGEFVGDEIAWRPPEDAVPGNPWSGASSEIKAAKYLARGILINLGMDVAVTQQDRGNNRQPSIIFYTLQNLSTTMAGNKTINLPITIQSEAAYIKSFGFSLPNGANLLALWNDGAAVDYDPGIPSKLIIPGFAGRNATAIDVLNGFEQELITTNDNGDMIISDFLLQDYPIIIRLSK